MNKKCFKCGLIKDLSEFYIHKQMSDGHLGKCKNCTKNDNSIKNGKERRICLECNKEFRTTSSEIKDGGGKTCSRKCYYNRLRKIIKRDSDSPNWKGNNVGKQALHNWVEKKLGKPMKCEKCGIIGLNRYEWANISRKYKRNIKDWIRLCAKCHRIYDGSKSRKNYKRLSIEEFNKLKI